MPRLRTLLSSIILLIVSPLLLHAQAEKPQWRYEGPRVGVDLSRFLMSGFQKAKRTGWEVQADIPWRGNFFPTIEIGSQKYDDAKDNFHYLNKGLYGRLGLDVNILKFESLTDYDLLFIGTRYGYSRFKHSADEIKIPGYWGDLVTSFPEKNMNAHWAEVVFGMKGELFSNFFIGWSVRAKFILSKTKDPNMPPYVIPGIGKTTSEVPFDFSFGAYYRFPIKRTKTIPKPLQMGSKSDPEEDEEEQNLPGSNQEGRSNSGGSRSFGGSNGTSSGSGRIPRL